MAQSSLEYWRQREAAQRDKNITEEAEYEKHIQKIYADTLDRVNKEINGFFVKYATKEGITIAEAKRRVSKLDIKEYSEKAKRYVEEKNFSEKANEEMRLYNLTMKVNRLELLKANIGLELIDGFSQLENYEGKILNDRTLAEMERQAGILGETVLEPAKKAHAIVNASFHNAQFSDRIWMYQDMLKSELSILLTRGLIQGLNPRQLAVDIKKRFGVSLSNATRLMRTEMARVQIGAQKQSYERNGYEEYEFIALTGHACEACQALDGKHFKVIKMQPGLNAPPMHPNCKCSTAGWMDREAMERELFGVQEESGSKTLLNKYGQEIIFDEKFLKNHSPEQIKLLKELAQEYDTRLLEVTGGAKNAAGDVTISGANMRLSSNGMSDALHEFAHTLANTDADKYGLTNDQAFWKEIKKIQKQYLKDVGGDTSRWISSYEHSSKSIDEFMAEAFAQAKMKQLGISIPRNYGSDFTYSQRVLDAVNRFFGRKDGASESGRLVRAAKRASEREALQELLRNSVTIGKPYIEPNDIQATAFSRKFSKLTRDTRINDKIRKLAQGNLIKNNGTYTEILDILDIDTGDSVLHKMGKKNALEVALSSTERASLKSYKGRVIGMHNHPTNIFPTGSDFVVAGARGYEFGLVITHDLRVFKYTPPKTPIDALTLDRIIDKYTRMLYTDNEKRKGFEKAMHELERRFGITWQEM